MLQNNKCIPLHSYDLYWFVGVVLCLIQVELLSVFHILVDMISSPVHLQEECDLLAINLIVKSQDGNR
jgi:hypothetical protein